MNTSIVNQLISLVVVVVFCWCVSLFLDPAGIVGGTLLILDFVRGILLVEHFRSLIPEEDPMSVPKETIKGCIAMLEFVGSCVHSKDDLNVHGVKLGLLTGEWMKQRRDTMPKPIYDKLVQIRDTWKTYVPAQGS